MKYGLHGHLKALPGKGEELANILLEAASLLSAADGCHLYVVSKDNVDENTVWITEVWDSKEAHHDSLKLDAVKALISKAIPILAEPPKGGQEMDVLGGLGV